MRQCRKCGHVTCFRPCPSCRAVQEEKREPYVMTEAHKAAISKGRAEYHARRKRDGYNVTRFDAGRK